jgi:hypothetical protein
VSCRTGLVTQRARNERPHHDIGRAATQGLGRLESGGAFNLCSIQRVCDPARITYSRVSENPPTMSWSLKVRRADRALRWPRASNPSRRWRICCLASEEMRPATRNWPEPEKGPTHHPDAPGQYVPHRTEAAALCREESHRGRAQPRVIPARRVPIGPPDARAPGGAGGAEPKKQFHVGVRFLSCGER